MNENHIDIGNFQDNPDKLYALCNQPGPGSEAKRNEQALAEQSSRQAAPSPHSSPMNAPRL